MSKTVVSEVARSKRALAVGIMCPSLVVVVAHLAVVQQSFEVSFITSFWSAVSGIFSSFIVGKEYLQRYLGV